MVSSPVTGVPPGGATGNSGAGNAGNSPSPTRATVPATVPATMAASPAEINAQVRRYFQSAGVTSLGATNGATQVVFNAANGLLLVRGTAQELSVIAQAIDQLNSLTPPSRK